MPDVTKDGAGNIRLIQNKTVVGAKDGGIVGTVAYPAASLKMVSATASTAAAVLTGVTGSRWLVEEARVILGSVASAAAVSLADGTTTYSMTFGSAGGIGVDIPMTNLNFLAASGATVTLGVGTAGAASSSTAILKGRLVLAADY